MKAAQPSPCWLSSFQSLLCVWGRVVDRLTQASAGWRDPSRGLESRLSHHCLSNPIPEFPPPELLKKGASSQGMCGHISPGHMACVALFL